MTSFESTADQNARQQTEQINVTAWRTVADAKVVYVPLGEVPGKDGIPRMRFARTGIRVEMADGSWWFKHFKSGTWTHHYPGISTVGKGFNAKATPTMHKQSYSQRALERDYATRPAMLEALISGEQLALDAEAEKRAASRAA